MTAAVTKSEDEEIEVITKKMASVEPSGLIETVWLNSNGRGCFNKLQICSHKNVIWVMMASRDVVPVHHQMPKCF